MTSLFEKVKPGMEKDQILDILGSPTRTKYSKGLDKWTYVFYEADIRQEKQIDFSEGIVVYSGNIIKPKPTEPLEITDIEKKSETAPQANPEGEAETASLPLSKTEETKQNSLIKPGTREQQQKQKTIKYTPTFKPINVK